MDGSDTDLCILYPTRRSYLRIRCDGKERKMIQACKKPRNEALVTSRSTWGNEWPQVGSSDLTHVSCWLDNKSAVSWYNTLSSKNPYSQELSRIISAVEAQFGIRVSAAHLAGAQKP
ncbi:hypothetical protein PHMEG_00022194 [Phytophthora megakarya]|uniref:Uncharacterized protein n=1 Tax=Phytophthora megakarya TaxID=4795 RepID=A0A225VKR6_9STRA|nr:hypothetical protein PHMEG_00022194 [Phytophthora megakarya]